MRFLPWLLTLLLLSPGLAQGQPPATELPAGAEDGPYVLWTGNQAQVLRVVHGKPETRPLARTHLLPVPGLTPVSLEPKPPSPPPCVLPRPARIAAVSDIHGNYQGLLQLLTAHKIIGKNRRWSFGQGHLVVVGDTFDRGGEVTECLWLLHGLEAQAAKAGGRVHVLLGNHEAMELAGDARYLNPKYAATCTTLGLDFPSLFGPASELGRWLRSRNTLLLLGDILFVHAGPSPARSAEPADLAAINQQIRDALGSKNRPAILGSDGPVWYRGLIPGASRLDASDAEITAILAAWHAQTLVVGHSTLPQITGFHQGRVFGIDAGLQLAKGGELWLWDQGKPYRGLASGERLPLP